MVLVALLRLLAITTVLAERCNVRDFGAVGDGATLDTASINKAISTARCTTILLPAPGRYLSGTVRLKSHMVRAPPPKHVVGQTSQILLDVVCAFPPARTIDAQQYRLGAVLPIQFLC